MVIYSFLVVLPLFFSFLSSCFFFLLCSSAVFNHLLFLFFDDLVEFIFEWRVGDGDQIFNPFIIIFLIIFGPFSCWGRGLIIRRLSLFGLFLCLFLLLCFFLNFFTLFSIVCSWLHWFWLNLRLRINISWCIFWSCRASVRSSISVGGSWSRGSRWGDCGGRSL